MVHLRSSASVSILSALVVFAAASNAAAQGGPGPGARDGGDAPRTSDAAKDRGLKRNEPGALQGYTLLSPLQSRSTYLVDMQGQVVHEWKTESGPGQSDYLLANGHLLRTARVEGETRFRGGGIGGRVQEFDWDGKLVWDYKISDEHHHQHHDIEPLPNGNVLMIVWESKTKEEALARGRDEAHVSDEGFWPDAILEVQPVLPDSGKVVWEWHVWDHLVQDRDAKKANYGKVAEHPELLDINADHRARRRSPRKRSVCARSASARCARAGTSAAATTTRTRRASVGARAEWSSAERRRRAEGRRERGRNRGGRRSRGSARRTGRRRTQLSARWSRRRRTQ